jgi:hypothetical protein
MHTLLVLSPLQCIVHEVPGQIDTLMSPLQVVPFRMAVGVLLGGGHSLMFPNDKMNLEVYSINVGIPGVWNDQWMLLCFGGLWCYLSDEFDTPIRSSQ